MIPTSLGCAFLSITGASFASSGPENPVLFSQIPKEIYW